MMKHLKAKNFLMLCLLLTVPLLAAAAGSIQGEVGDSKTGTPIPGVKVSIFQDGETVKETTTDEESNYSITGIPEGTYWIRFAKNDYRDELLKVQIKEGPATIQDAELNPLPPIINTDPSGGITITGAQLRSIPGDGAAGAVTGLIPGAHPSLQ